ncbi:HAD-IA family hydrolase [Parasphingopyxis lamellibrachiae]|uniref:Putative hydrolase of the HAD superfamily n=1 Tax=Parasphingopyxis lamellibrachiae TaxID=680125 RepID=A0A3D9FDC3_9SPHN|nr:HAD-IA family hydrolase [Parasphingopyxis lamellibrachiae]RED15061.1 putative hydrolase of the HAD superfamily [Parasphingopyxis lamellibrachiae]
MSYSAIIWDFGGVITSSPFDAFNRMEEARGMPVNSVRRINATNPDGNAWALFERAEIDAAQFDELFAEEARAMGVELRGSDVLACLSGDIRPKMVAALDVLKSKGHKLGCITNNVPAGKGAGMAGSEQKAMAIADIMTRFDHVIESSKAGVRKPDPRIYQMMCETLDVEPAECVYLDDLGINCKPAAALGMAAIKVTGEAQALDDLGTVLELQDGWL